MRLATARSAPPADGTVSEAEATFSALVRRLQSEESCAHVSQRSGTPAGATRPRVDAASCCKRIWTSGRRAMPTTPVVGADGVPSETHGRTGSRALETLLGTVDVTREGHGARGRETLSPHGRRVESSPTERYSFGIRRKRGGGRGDQRRLRRGCPDPGDARARAPRWRSAKWKKSCVGPPRTSTATIWSVAWRGPPRPARRAKSSCSRLTARACRCARRICGRPRARPLPQRQRKADDAADEGREAAREADRPGGGRL